MYQCWPGLLSTNAAAVDMLSRLSDRFNKPVCGVLPTDGAVVDGSRGGLISPLLFASGRSAEQPGCLSSPSVAAFTRETDGDAEAELPCLAFGSEDGFQVFSFAENRMRSDEVAMRLARGRRHVPSPHGGKVFVTDMCGRHPCHLVDPFTGERTPLPDLPVPLSEEEPMAVLETDRSEPRYRLSTDDAFAWDWSPHGVIVARGDTVFFCKAGGDEWTPVHRSSHGSAMTVNYRGGFFFVLEELSLRTAVIDAETLDRSAEIDPPPRDGGVHLAFLVTSTDNVLLLVSRDGYRSTFTHAYRAHRPRQDGPVQWEQVKNIGDRAVFVDGAHGFTVRAGGRVRRNCVYVSKTVELDDDGGMARVVAVSPLNDLRKVAMAEGGEALRRCKIEPVWGISHWMICNHGPSPSLGSSNHSNLALEH
ncbi:hypothetical protein CFC21_096402 [Triticum aestivum]|uniref:KIB1-4 beta-propeller domain-containing protein n=2 Tax=Triticum aestivum TaxID=4565 RepID=A0A3B6REC8_WHEAT|nr:hypothetical protein CFC21_096402 [Triticum aestivum]